MTLVSVSPSRLDALSHPRSSCCSKYTETYTWSKPKVLGTVPPVTRAHSVVAVDERIYVFGGGDGPTYYNDLYYFDTREL